jgi:DMSO/TMAO reductase YedYZ molybdopterin-dependent catalytic subunit
MAPARRARPHSPRRWIAGAAAGLLAALAAVLASEALAALLTGVTSPLLAVGNRAVDATPLPLKEFAIRTFGSHDKQVLIGGVVVTVFLLAALAGALGVRRPRVALGVFVLLSLVAGAAVVTDRASTAGVPGRLVPVVALVVVGAVGLLLLLRTLRSPSRSSAAGGARAADTAPTRDDGSAAPTSAAAPVDSVEQGPRRTRESPRDGKPRLLVGDLGGRGDLMPAHVAGDDLPPAFDRRAFLVTASAVGAVAVVGGGVRQAFGGSAAAAARSDVTLPRAATPAPAVPSGAQLDVPGISPYLTPSKDFYRVDTALRVPDVPVDGFTLRVHGLVDHELNLSFEDLLSRRLVERRITLTCVSNPVGGKYVGNATWLGIPVRDLLAEAGVRSGADAVKSTSADKMTIGTPLQALDDPHRDALIAVGMNGQPLPLEHGFPVRMVVPGLYGYVSATKWLVDLEVTRFADFKAYWSTRGYSVRAPIKTSSRIDVPKPFQQVKKGRVPVAGVAWSQDRGIRAVEVRVDGGPWQRAELAAQDNIDTWRQWTWMWDAEPGNHTIEVRATDDTGYTQTDARAAIAPNGSTGWHSVNVTSI